MVEQEPQTSHSAEQPETDTKNSLADTALSWPRFEDLARGLLGGRLAAIEKTVEIPDEELTANDELFGRGSHTPLSSD